MHIEVVYRSTSQKWTFRYQTTNSALNLRQKQLLIYKNELIISVCLSAVQYFSFYLLRGTYMNCLMFGPLIDFYFLVSSTL